MHYHVNGDLVPAGDATVPVTDRGFAYGDAAFETLRAYGGEPFEWDAHYERLQRTAETLGFADAVPEDLRDRIDETLAANDLADAYVKVSVTRGTQPGTLTPGPDVDPTVVVIVKPLPRGGVDGERPWDVPATVQTVRTRRAPSSAIPADAKTHSYLNGLMGRIELQQSAVASGGEGAVGGGGDDEDGGEGNGDDRSDAGVADECLLRDVEDRVVEGATSNLFFVSGEGLRTPSADLDLLPGITREVVLDLAREESFPVETGHYGVDAVRDADEAFLTNSTWEVRPIASVDGIPIGAGPITRLLQRLFDEYVEARYYE